MARREFTKAIKIEITKRAMRSALTHAYCEKCGAITRKWEIHHLREDGLEVDKSKALTAADGALWCKPCHDEHTKKYSIPVIAKVKRIEAKHMGVKSEPTIQSKGFLKKAARRVPQLPMPPRRFV